jgi:hypothetical protein
MKNCPERSVVGKLEGRPLGKPSFRWEENVNGYFK